MLTKKSKMKKLESYKDFKKGEIYNRIYVGDNTAYAGVEGKETFQVLEIEPVLKVEILFGRSGSIFTNDLRGPIIEFINPQYAFREFELFEPIDKNEWFIKSVKVASIADALNAGYITHKETDNREILARFFITCLDTGVYLKFYSKGIPTNPYLQTVMVLWKTWDNARTELAQYRSKISY